jgi:hypothetical protein
MVFYTLCISVFNLALGFALALYLQSRGMSPGWLRPDFFSRLKLPRFGRNQGAPASDPPAKAIATHAATTELISPFDRQPIESVEFGVGAATTTGSLEPALTRSE